jgi:hypothetical protein
MSIIISGNTLAGTNVNASGQVKSFNYLPDDGMVLNMNANNYKDADSTWNDSIYGITFNGYNSGAPYSTGKTPKTTVNNIPCITFNGASYWESSAADAYKVDLRGAFTMIALFYFPSNSARHNLFEKAGTSYASYQQELATTWETNNTLSWYRSGGQDGTYDYSSTKEYTINRWTMVAIKGTANHSAGYYYDQSSGWVSNYGNRSDTNILQSGVMRIGNGYTGIMQVGYLHALMIWNVDLNATRIGQVYNYYSNQFQQLGTTLYA